MNDVPDPLEACLRHLVAFVRSGDISQAGTAVGSIVAYLAKLEGTDAQLTALDKLQEELVLRIERATISGEAEDRHIAVDDAIEQARATLDEPPPELRRTAQELAEGLGVGRAKRPGG